MPNPDASTPVVLTGAALGGRLAELLFWVFPAVIWGVFFWQASSFWDPESHYFFGWVVPPLGIYLLARRWQLIRHLPDTPMVSMRWAVVGILPAYLILRMVAFADLFPMWNLPMWLLGAVALLSVTLYFAAMRGWGTAVYLLLPQLFFLTALPWPTAIHLYAVDTLTDSVAATAVEILSFAGHPADLVGQRILIGNESVEVGEACSGIRSLQALVMCAFFLGELGRLHWIKRMGLFLGAAVASYITNSVRAWVLGLVSLEGGIEAFDKWHDNTGAIAFVVAIALLFALFSWWDVPEAQSKPKPTQPLSKPPRLLLAGCGCLVLIELLLPLVYGYKKLPAYAVEWETLNEMGFYEENVLAPLAEDLLKFDVGRSITAFVGGKRLDVAYFEWAGGIELKVPNAHTPDECMGNYGGMELIEQTAPRLMQIQDIQFVFDPYRFIALDGSTIQVFRSVLTFPDTGVDADPFQYSMSKTHFRKFTETLRFLAQAGAEDRIKTQRLLFIGVRNAGTEQEEWNRLKPLLTELVQPI